MTNKWYPRILYIVTFTDLLAISLVVPLIGTHLKSLGASHLVIGFIGSLYSALQLISSPIIGSWSDIRGHRLILLHTLVVCSVCYLFWGFTSSLVITVVIRFVLGAFKHTQTLVKALVADSVPHSYHSEIYGKLNAIAGVGFMIGPAIGGHLAELENGFFYICCVVAATFWINIGLVYFLIPENAQITEKDDINETQDMKISVKEQFFKILSLLESVEWSIFWDIFALKFIVGFSVSVFHSNYVLYIQETFDMSVKFVGYTISFQGMIGAISSYSVSHLQKLYQNDPFFNVQMLHGFIVLAASFCVLALAPNFKIFTIGLIFISASGAFIRVVGLEILLQRTDVNKRGSLMGTSNSISSIARLVAPMCGGLFHDIFGAKSIFVLSELVTVVGVVLAYSLCKDFVKERNKIT